MKTLFLEVFPGLGTGDALSGALERAEVLSVRVSAGRKVLSVMLKCSEKIPTEVLKEAGEAIRDEILGAKDVRVEVLQVQGTETGEAVTKQKLPKKPGQRGYKEAGDRQKPKTDRKSQDQDIIYGYDFSGELTPISELEEGSGSVIVEGRIFSSGIVSTKSGKYVLSFNITDGTDSVAARLFLEDNAKKEMERQIRDGSCVRLFGTVEPPSRFQPDLSIGRIRGIRKIPDISLSRADTHEGKKRIELSLHTRMSDMDATGDISEYIRIASAWGWKALALTDTDTVQAFPAASVAKTEGLKLIYGASLSVADDAKDAVYKSRGQSLTGEFVVFDIETTGFSMRHDRIIEIGAVKVSGGVIKDRFSEFVDPGMPLPQRIRELTSISDEDLRGAGDISVHLPRFLDFVGDAPVVGHNALFDVGFMINNAAALGLYFDPTVVDTLGLSHLLLKKLTRNRLDNIARELGVTLSAHHRAVSDAEATAGIFIKFVKMLKERGIYDLDQLYEADVMDEATVKKLHAAPLSVLVLNDLGRTNLYRLISAAHVDFLSGGPRLPMSLVLAMREGLLIGSGPEEGDLFDRVLRGVPDDELEAKIAQYDYIELIPPSALVYLIVDESSPVRNMEDIYEAERRLFVTAEKLGKIVVASGNVHFVREGEEIYRKIVRYFESSVRGRRYDEEKYGAPLYLRTTDEMLSEFDFLGDEASQRIVVENPSRIADMAEPIAPVRPDTCPPVIEDSDRELRETCLEKAHEMYGDELPQMIGERLTKELDSIIKNGYSVMYIIAKRLVMDSMEHGYLVGSRGSVGSSLAATFAGISEVNPLPAHYRCPVCRYSDFDSEAVRPFRMRSGYDLPDRDCPVCGGRLTKDGFDIPFETFLGFHGEKEPDIDLNFAGEYQAHAHAYTEELFGEGQIFKAGTIGTIQEKTAFAYVLKYNEEKERAVPMRRAEIERLALGCTDVRRTTGQHPGGIVVLPKGEEMTSFTPVQYPANDSSNMITTHFDYHSIAHNLLKLDILGKDDPSMVRMLEDLTGINPMDIPIGTREVMSLFSGTEALGITPEDIGGTMLGTLGVPEFGTDFAMQMLIEAKPRYVSDLVRISGLAHGTDVWIGNAQKLISEGTCTIDTAICTRDDIMIYLSQMSLPSDMCFNIMELVRKGKFATNARHDEYCELMRAHNVPDWYIKSCETIKYMFPKAHAAAYVVMSLRIAYYKVHHPKEYYTAYFSVKGQAFDYQKMCVSLPRLREEMRELRDAVEQRRDASANDKLLLRDMRIVEEMLARGIEFAPLDIYRAKAGLFTLTDDGRIMPSIDSVSGLGAQAAASIEEDAKKGEYLSIEEFVSRTKVTRSGAELLRELGLLKGLPDSNQLSLFDLMGR